MLGRAALVLLALVSGVGPARAQVPPDGSWKTLETEHFRVTFPEHLEGLGREAAARAERAYDLLSEAFHEPPGGRTEIVVTDHVDASNGFARAAPVRQITLFARPPVDGFALSHFDDWMELVIVHELAHVFHFEVAGPVGDVLRSVFGRVPVPWPFFPGLATPRWTIEGLATWYESALTGSGRVRGSYHDMIVRTALLEGRFEDPDEASGASPVWPGGQRPYVYGSLFFDHLLDRYGESRMGDFVDAVGDQLVPYRLNAAAEDAFGISFSEAWKAWRKTLEAEVGRLRSDLTERAPLTRPEPVTRRARFALYPAVGPRGERLAFSRSDGRDDTQLRVASLDGSAQERLTRSNGSSRVSWTPDGDLVFSQLEFTDPYRIRSDLYRATPDGDVSRITRGARVEHPSVTPDGSRAVVVETGDGTTRLATVDLEDGTLRPLGEWDPDTHWAYPAVSPDGRWIAASRWRPGAFFDVVVLDRRGRVVAEVTHDRALDVAPTWSPDGRWLLWSSDRSGISNILAAEIDPATGRPHRTRQVTNLLTGALLPSVDPAGRWIHFSGYHVDGWEIERIPFEPDRWFEPFPLDERFVASSDPAPAPAPVEAEVEGYNPLNTLAPRFWQPVFRESVHAGKFEVIGESFGISTTAEDLLGRHALDLDLALSTSDARASGGASYRWAGLGNPVLSLTATQFWDAAGPFEGERSDGAGERLFVTERERSLSAGVTVLRQRFRQALSVRLGGGLVWEDRSLLDESLRESTSFQLREPSSRLSTLSLSGSFSTVRGHSFSVGPEEGVSLFALGRTRSDLELADSVDGVVGRDRSFNEALGRVRIFTDFPGPGYADHVLALRVSGGVAEGPGADAFHFDLGGTSGTREPFTGLALFGGRTFFFPVRGYANGEQVGRYVWSASAEYRFPLVLVNEGIGLFPLHLDKLSGTLFFDAGNAWGPELGEPAFQNPRRDPLTSVGGEILTELLTFFSIPVTLRTGIAVRLDDVEGTEFYLRLGRSF